jgi:hypothetical protein
MSLSTKPNGFWVAVTPVVSFRMFASLSVTDALVDMAVQLQPHMQRLVAERLDLRSDAHSTSPWPWQMLEVGTFSVSALLRLPDPSSSGDGTSRVIRCQQVVIDARVCEVRNVSPCLSLSLSDRHTHSHTHAHAILEDARLVPGAVLIGRGS